MNITRAHLAAIISFSLWGLFPIYWKLFDNVPAWDLFGHRLVWSFITLFSIILFTKKFKLLKEIWNNPKKRLMLILSAFLISSNWLLYIYAISIDRIIEASMGYFLNPIINVFMGWVILKEKIRPTQWPSIILVLISILMLAFTTDLAHFPWIALLLSITFALYGLIRKLVHVGSLEGLTFETAVVIIPTLLYWHFQPTSFTSVYQDLPLYKSLILCLAGIVTSFPLILFAYSAQRLPLQTLGMIQYLSPSFKFLCGFYIFHEALDKGKLNAFILIWIALAWYTIESFQYAKKSRRQVKVTNE